MELVAPDSASLEGMGTNRMDFTRVAGAVEPGMRQEAAAAAHLREVWGVAAAPGTTG